MARKKRFYRSKSSPEMGWIIDVGEFTITKAAGANSSATRTLYDFGDLDPEALTGSIQQDKSDWFAKRVIIDVYPTFAPVGTLLTDTARVYDIAVATGSPDDIASWTGNAAGVMSNTFYDSTARIFRMWSRPVYATAVIPMVGSGEAGRSGILTDTTIGGDWDGYGVCGQPWGNASIHEDFEVSNAGLKQDQVCAVFCTTPTNGPGGYDWQTGDGLAIMYKARILMQKRRNA